MEKVASKLDVKVTSHEDLSTRISQELRRREAKDSMKEYPYVLVLELADRSLHDSMSHDHIAGASSRCYEAHAPPCLDDYSVA